MPRIRSCTCSVPGVEKFGLDTNAGEMPGQSEVQNTLREFLTRSTFATTGGIVTDLDGTALHEDRGKIYIPKPVELGYKRLLELGRPFVLNTLRFPQSVLRTFGRDWYSVSNAPIPAVTLNGSLLGFVTQNENQEMSFEEIAAFPMTHEEISRTMEGLHQLIEGGVKDLLLFYYPRDWRIGEVIWTPVADRVMPVRNKYLSASSVTAVELSKLDQQLHAEDICMMTLLIDDSAEKLMAYQRTRGDNFITRAGVDKLFGAERMAESLQFQLESSIGAGDTELDRFLSGVGLAVLVGPLPLNFRGTAGTVRLNNPYELGHLLFETADILMARRN